MKGKIKLKDKIHEKETPKELNFIVHLKRKDTFLFPGHILFIWLLITRKYIYAVVCLLYVLDFNHGVRIYYFVTCFK